MTSDKFKNLIVRPARLSDCRACQRLGRVLEIAIAPGWYLPLEYYQQIIRHRQIFQVAVIKNKIMGFVIGESIVAGVLIQYIVVAKSYRRQGISQKLLRVLENIARQRGAYFLLSYGVVKSPGIQRSFAKLGYRRGQLAQEWMKGLTPQPPPRKIRD